MALADVFARMMARQPVPQQWATDAAYPPAPSTVPGQTEPGNINVFNRPMAPNPDGSTSTVRSMSYGGRSGETLIPTVSNEGTIMPARQAMGYWGQKGQHLGKFNSPAAADDYAQKLHEQQAVFYGLR